MRNALPAAGAIACAVALVFAPGCGRKSAAPAAVAPAPTVRHVTIHKLAFTPAELVAAPNDTIVWANDDLVPHTVTARDGRFNSGNLPPDSIWRWVVTGADSAGYSCSYHTTMHGVVRIKAGG